LGYEVVSIASTGKDAINKAGELKPDLVLMDIFLKGNMDGIEATSKIQSAFNIPVIYLTAYSDENTLKRAKLTKPYGFLTKPVNYDGLSGAIETALYNHGLNQKLVESEEKYRRIVETANEGIWAIDKDYITTFVNQRMAEILGYTIEEMVGQIYTSFLFDEDEEKYELKMESLKQGTSEQYEWRIKHKNGSKIWVNISATPIKDESGSFNGSFAMFTDITKEKKAKELAVESEAKFESLYSSIAEGVAIQNVIYDSSKKPLDYIITDINPAFENILKLKKDEVVGKKASIIYGTGKAPYLDIYAGVAETGKSKHFETYFEPMDKHFQITVTSPGRGKFATFFEDITKRKKYEEDLKRSEKRYKDLTNLLPLIVCETDENTNITFYNETAMDISGYSKEEIDQGLNIVQMLIPEDRERARKSIQMKIEGKSLDSHEYTLLRNDGSTAPVIIYSSPIIEDNEYKGLRTVLVDITEVKNVQKSLEESKERYKALIESSPEAIVVIDRGGKITFASPKALEIFNVFKAEDIIGKNALQFVSPPYRKQAWKDLNQIINEGYPTYAEYEFIKTDGTNFMGELTASLLKNRDGTPKSIILAARELWNR
ncbi:MAG: PAS domain S-box protein, partial [Methanobacterium sp.]